jgi:hypothetical protein
VTIDTEKAVLNDTEAANLVVDTINDMDGSAPENLDASN